MRVGSHVEFKTLLSEIVFGWAGASCGTAAAVRADPSGSRGAPDCPALHPQLPAPQHRPAHGPSGESSLAMRCTSLVSCIVPCALGTGCIAALYSMHVCVCAAACSVVITDDLNAWPAT